jgi:hypothetical protein
MEQYPLPDGEPGHEQSIPAASVELLFNSAEGPRYIWGAFQS